MIHGFDIVDFSSSRPGDKFAKSGFTRGQATRVGAPTVNEAPIQLECRLIHTLRVPPMRTVFIAEVVATTVHDGVCDGDGRLRPESAAFFGMAAGCGEFFTLGQRVGHIGQSVGRRDIRILKTQPSRRISAGSSRDARHAGTRLAARPTTQTIAAASTNVIGSRGLDPESRDAISVDAQMPIARPHRDTQAEDDGCVGQHQRAHLGGVAPIAMRMPISVFRCATE